MKLRHLMMVPFMVAVLLAVHPAFAFTADNNSDTNHDGSSKFSDPDEQFDSSDTPGASPLNTLNFGNGSSMSFGVPYDATPPSSCAGSDCGRSALN